MSTTNPALEPAQTYPDVNLTLPGAPASQLADDHLLEPTGEPLSVGNAMELLEDEAGDLELRQRVAEALLTGINWDNPSLGHAECPGAVKHTTGGNDLARIYLDGPPTLHCFHQSCARVVEEFNRDLRRQIWQAERGQSTAANRPPTPEQLARRAWNRELASRRPGWERWFLRVIKKPLTPRFLFQHSPTALSDRTGDDRFSFLRLWHPRDLIWTGEPDESGIRNFAAVDTLLKQKRLRSHHVSTAAFKPRTDRRTNANVLTRRFLVIESDVLSLPQQTALLWGLRAEWPLAAVVYSGGKSLHGWFRWQEAWNTKEALMELKARLKTYHCDTACLTPSQPYRLPGVMRPETLKFQSLIYLNHARH